ncbi:MAG TPA: AmmeMemoRadiSam system protein B [Candidatus Woesebacteria bacterium]|nr:AmmeMemoRadiSam system protein B [Candidatus Woesebacteria bacterium]
MTANKHFWGLVLMVIGLTCVGLAICSYISIKIFECRQSHLPDHTTGYTHQVVFFEDELFFEGVRLVKQNSLQVQPHIMGGIVPHHLVASQLIADFFYRLTNQKPKTIIILGPNHLERGEKPVLSSIYNWKTSFGVVEPQRNIIVQLRDKKVINIDENTVSSDHSITSLMPFLEYYLPDTKVVPLLISGLMDQSQINKLANHLAKVVNEDVVLIAAVDFSHNLIGDQARQKDQITYHLMMTRQYDQLRNLNNQYLDSPSSIIALLKTMELVGATQSDLIYNTNSGEISGDHSVGSTSYFSIVYY